jgi:hypothetical protein
MLFGKPPGSCCFLYAESVPGLMNWNYCGFVVAPHDQSGGTTCRSGGLMQKSAKVSAGWAGVG